MTIMSQMYAPGWRGSNNNKCSMDIIYWRTIIWQQFGAAMNMLENTLRACPDGLWRDNIWDDPTDAPEYTQFWFIAYHALFWTDLYLSGSRREDFVPPALF